MNIKKLLLIILLGIGYSTTSFSQVLPNSNCLGSFKNNTNCPITLCFDVSVDCPTNTSTTESGYDGVADAVERICQTIQPNSTEQICLTPSGNCAFMSIIAATIGTGNSTAVLDVGSTQLNTFLAILSGLSNESLQINISTEGNEGPCSIITLNRNSNGEFEISPVQECPPYCIKNIDIECPIELVISTNCLDNPCTPEIENLPGNFVVSNSTAIGQTNCVDFGTGSNGCRLCPCGPVTLSVCIAGVQSPNPQPNVCFQLTGNSGQGQLMCGNRIVNIKYILVNGVYEISIVQ